MFSFLFGSALGAAGYWAYSHGMLPGGARKVIDQTAARVMSVAGISPASAPERASSSDAHSPIIMPTASEVSGRPSEPIPGPGVTSGSHG